MDQIRFGGMPGFEARLLPQLKAIPFFRLAPEHEVALSYEAYAARDIPRLIEVWRTSADPTRATLRGTFTTFYRRASLLPKAIVRVSFLATVRAALAAGKVFFGEQLRPATAQAIRSEFSHFDRRHEHIPPGYTPALRFPTPFVDFIDGGSLAEAKGRFQLVAALNEVQQHCYSLFLADLFQLPELVRHAAREKEMALAYFKRWSPDATIDLWRQSIYILDALNAAVFAMACQTHALTFSAATLWHALVSQREWQSFVENLDHPQFLA